MTGPTVQDLTKTTTPELIRIFNRLKAQGPNISLEDMIIYKMTEDLIRKRKATK